MPGPGSPTSGLPIKRACDCCHKRKVKCIGDGSRPCKNCTAAGLTCTYNTVPQKKGPKGSRAKVISELRETQRQSQLAISNTNGGILAADGTHKQTPFAPVSDILSMELITACVEFFFTNLYPTQPILHRIKVGETIGQMDTNPEAYCLVASLCSYMLIQPNMNLPPEAGSDGEDAAPTHMLLGRTLLQDVLRVRKGSDYVETPTIWSVITSFFLFGSHFCLDKHNTAWFHLREATTLALVINMHEEESYTPLDPIESSRRRRLFWLLFVTERAYALQRHRPLTLHPTIELPSLDQDPTESVELSGFVNLVALYRPFDDAFVGLWNKSKQGCTTEWLARLQTLLSEALPQYLRSTEAQAVDLRVSQQWLRTMVWQLSISHGYLSSADPDSPLSLKYPIQISHDLVGAISGFSQHAMEVHGIGLIEKLFDIACTLIDVMSCVPIEQYTFEFGPCDYLHSFLSTIANLRGGRQRYYPLLVTKINETLPSMSTPGGNPFLTSVPELSRPGLIQAHSNSTEYYDPSHPTTSNGRSSVQSSGSSSVPTPFGSPAYDNSLQQQQQQHQQHQHQHYQQQLHQNQQQQQHQSQQAISQPFGFEDLSVTSPTIQAFPSHAVPFSSLGNPFLQQQQQQQGSHPGQGMYQPAHATHQQLHRGIKFEPPG